MEGDPFLLIEGMTIAAHAVGATEGYIYIRSEYPDAITTMRSAIEIAYAHGWLGRGILGSATCPSTSSSESAPAHTSAAKRPRCSRALRANAPSCAPSRRCRLSKDCSASRPSSTTS